MSSESRRYIQISREKQRVCTMISYTSSLKCITGGHFHTKLLQTQFRLKLHCCCSFNWSGFLSHCSVKRTPNINQERQYGKENEKTCLTIAVKCPPSAVHLIIQHTFINNYLMTSAEFKLFLGQRIVVTLGTGNTENLKMPVFLVNQIVYSKSKNDHVTRSATAAHIATPNPNSNFMK